MERARASLLAWGNDEQHAAIADRFGLFDVVIGADVVYAPEAIHSLFKSCSAMLTSAAHARLVLCYVVRRVSEDSIIAIAADFGLTLQASQPTITVAANKAMVTGAYRLLVFCRT